MTVGSHAGLVVRFEDAHVLTDVSYEAVCGHARGTVLWYSTVTRARLAHKVLPQSQARDGDHLDGAADKRLFWSIASHYDTRTSLRELIENAAGSWRPHEASRRLNLAVELDVETPQIAVIDNAGGVALRDLTEHSATPSALRAEGLSLRIRLLSVWYINRALSMTVSKPKSLEEAPGRPSLPIIGRAMLGYFSAAVGCTLAGYWITHAVAPSLDTYAMLVSLWLVALPAYWNHAACYDQQGVNPDFAGIVKQLGFQVPLYFGVPIGMLCFLVVVQQYRNEPATQMSAAIRIAAAVAPLYALVLKRRWSWPNATLVEFRHRCFFPALATCLPFFVYGCTEVGEYHEVLFASSVVLVYWAAAFLVPAGRLAILGAFALFAAAFFLVVSPSVADGGGEVVKAINLCIFGVLLTLAMGVTEAWRTTSRILADVEYRSDIVYTADQKLAYHGGTNIAMAACLPIFLMTYLHPRTSLRYLVLVVLAVSAEYAMWFVIRRYQDHQLWWKLSVATGLGLPLVLGAGVYQSSVDVAAFPLAFDPQINTWLTVALFSAAAIGWLNKQMEPTLVKWLFSGRPARAMVGVDAAVALTGVVTCVMIEFATLGLWVSRDATTQRQFFERLKTLDVVYILIACVCVVVIWLRDQLGYSAADSHSTRTSRPPEQETLARTDVAVHRLGPFAVLKALVSTARPVPSLLAAALVMAVLIASRTDLGPIVTLRAAGTMLLVTMVGFVVNDLFDLQKDRKGAVQRPLALGVISPAVAIGFALALVAALMLIEPRIDGSLGIAALTLAAVLSYSWFARKVPLFKGVYTASLSCAPLVYACEVAGVRIGYGAIAALFVFVVGRECCLDALDMHRDAMVGMRTVAVRFGRSRAKMAGMILMAMSGIAAFLLAQGLIPSSFAAIGLAVIVWSSVAAGLTDRARVDTVRFAMICGAIALASCVY